MVKSAIISKGYKFFTGKYNVNLVGIRGRNRGSDLWDDMLCVLYQDSSGSNIIKVFSDFTTDPGSYYLQNPLPEVAYKGTAVPAPGQYRGLWKIGLHRGSKALQQVGYLNVYRDNNRDKCIDMTGTYERCNDFAINLHHGGGSSTVGQNSAGCQVLKSETDLVTLLDICSKQSTYGYGSTFTYTLIDEKDIKIL